MFIFCMFFFFFKQKTAYEMRISDWSSDVCSSDLLQVRQRHCAVGVAGQLGGEAVRADRGKRRAGAGGELRQVLARDCDLQVDSPPLDRLGDPAVDRDLGAARLGLEVDGPWLGGIEQSLPRTDPDRKSTRMNSSQ